MKLRILRLLPVLLLLLPFHVMGQVQLGYVKTKGRLAANGSVVPGVRVSGASVIIKGGNAVVSNAKGNFQLSVPNKKFHLVNVKKSGYILTDPDILSKQYTSSSNPLVIALEKPEEQSEEKMAAMKKIRRTLERQLQEKEDEIDALKAQDKLSAEAYSKALQELYAEREKNGTLIEEMAERYSRIDYDQLDGFNRRVSELILNGELLKADSLLNTKGDIRTGIADYQRLQQANANEEAALAQRQTNLEKSKALEQQQRDDLAQRCYSKYEIFKLQHQNDSAAYYIELRASLDTTNVIWTANAGLFLSSYMADYDKALEYTQKALNSAVRTYGENCVDVSLCYNNMGQIYLKKGDYSKAGKCFSQSLKISLSIFGENHKSIIREYTNLCNLFQRANKFKEALKYSQKALDICKIVYEEDNIDKVVCYNNVGMLYEKLGEYVKAQEFLQKALDMGLRIFGETNVDVAACYNNLGALYNAVGDFDKAIASFEKSQSIKLTLYGPMHPDVASANLNMGSVYSGYAKYLKSRGDSKGWAEYGKKSIELEQKALGTMIPILGVNHPNVALAYNNLGSSYYVLDDFDSALENYQKALAIYRSFFGENHIMLATSYNNIGVIYDAQGNFDKGEEYNQKALALSLVVYGERHPTVANSYNNLGIKYLRQKSYVKALDYFQKALDIRLLVNGKDHIEVYRLYNYMYICLTGAEKAGLNTGELKFDDFMADKAFTARVVSSDTPAGKQGMTGEYYLFEYGGWNQSQRESLFDISNELQGKPKTLLVMKDGVFLQPHFEDEIGVKLEVRYVGKEEKQRITEAYHAWRAKNK